MYIYICVCFIKYLLIVNENEFCYTLQKYRQATLTHKIIYIYIYMCVCVCVYVCVCVCTGI